MSTEIEVAGIKLRGGKMFLVITVLSSLVGALWGGFEFYKDYLDMKKQIQSYVAPDLSGFDKRLTVIEETTTKTNDYVRDIKNDLKNDVRKVEKVVETVERETKDRQREMDKDIREIRADIEEKIKKALENPLSNMATNK